MSGLRTSSNTPAFNQPRIISLAGNGPIAALVHGLEQRLGFEVDVRDYHEQLLAAGVEGFDWERCWADYRAFAFAGFHMAVLASMVVQRTDRGDAMFLAMAGGAGRHAQQRSPIDALDRGFLAHVRRVPRPKATLHSGRRPG